MTSNDRTEPMAPSASERGAPQPWPAYGAAYDAPTIAPRQPLPPRPLQQLREPRRPRPALWAALGFLAGVILTAILALGLLAPAPAPTESPTTNAALKVTLTDALLTNSLNAAPPSGSVTLTRNRVHIQSNGQIVVSGTLSAGALTSGSPYTIVAQPYVNQNTLTVKVLRASVSGLALPTIALGPIQGQLNQQLAQSSRISLGVGQALVVSGVGFANGAMTITYATAG